METDEPSMPLRSTRAIRAGKNPTLLTSTFLLIAWMGGWGSISHAAENPFAGCVQTVLRIWSGDVPSSLSQLELLIDRQFTGFRGDPKVRDFASQTVATRALVKELIRLPAEQRELLLHRLSASPPRDADYAKLLRLALYDRETWTAYLEQLSTTGDPVGAMNGSVIRPMMTEMPEDLKTDLYAFVRERYSSLSKRRVGPRSGGSNPEKDGSEKILAPKRALDAFIRHTLKGDELIRSRIRSGASPLEAYGAYISQIQAIIGNNAYSGHQVLDACLALQKEMRTRLDPQSSILLFGSFPNGRANLQDSDIDMISVDQGLWPAIREAVPEMNRVFGPDAHLRPENHGTEIQPSDLDRMERYFAEISPVQIIVGPNRIDLLIYPPIENPALHVKPEVHRLR